MEKTVIFQTDYVVGNSCIHTVVHNGISPSRIFFIRNHKGYSFAVYPDAAALAEDTRIIEFGTEDEAFNYAESPVFIKVLTDKN